MSDIEGTGVERDSQISAMFDGELAEAECELLSRRLVRDEALKAKWGRYALIGAAMRGDLAAGSLSTGPGGRTDLADRVADELATVAASVPVRGGVRGGWLRGTRGAMLGTAIAAGVAAAAILLVRMPLPGESPLQAATGEAAPAAVAAAAPERLAQGAAPVAPAEPEAAPSYTVPATGGGASRSFASTQLANYVVAHSEFVNPLARLNRLSALAIGDTDAIEQERGMPASNGLLSTPATIADYSNSDVDAVR